jgi:hypothetical protein
MGEDVVIGPASGIEARPLRQEGETGAGKVAAPLAREHRIEHAAQLMRYSTSDAA